MRYQRHWLTRWLPFVFTLCLLTPFYAKLDAASAEEQPVLQLHQIAIGCADAYLLKLDDIAIMIDGGNDTERSPEKLKTYLDEAGFDHLTAYFVTHYHDDHAGNLRLFMEAFGTEDTVVYGPTETLSDVYGPLPTGEYRQMKDNDVLNIGPLQFFCVGPQEIKYDGAANADSLNFIVTYGERRFLFTGDYAHSKAFLDQHADDVRDIDVLKFPHHGLEPFLIGERTLRLVNPSIILVPGSPHQGC